jgi:hypothetical protein
VTHEYVIALGGSVLSAGTPGEPAPTAVAWAADSILAVGSDEAVRAISRGDSIFLDLAGCAVSPAPSDPKGAENLLRAAAATGDPFDAVELLVRAGLVEGDARLEPGATCDLAFWSADPETASSASAPLLRIVAIVRAGAFTHGDEHRGPFELAVSPARSGEPPT